MSVIVEQLVEWSLAREIEITWENLTQCHFDHQKFHMARPGLEPGSMACYRDGFTVSYVFYPISHLGIRDLFIAVSNVIIGRITDWFVNYELKICGSMPSWLKIPGPDWLEGLSKTAKYQSSSRDLNPQHSRHEAKVPTPPPWYSVHR
jgi:hypothetical protein